MSMAYMLEAIIGKTSTLNSTAPELDHARVVPLNEELSLIPLTKALFGELQERFGEKGKKPFEELWQLSTAAAQFAIQLSQNGMVAYVEAEFFGGVGEQAAVVWQNGQVIAGPWRQTDAINRALRQFNVDKKDHYDEFEAVGLDRHRATWEWLEEIAT
jgi:hypothetical protein